MTNTDSCYPLKLVNRSQKVAITTGNLYLFLETEKLKLWQEICNTLQNQ